MNEEQNLDKFTKISQIKAQLDRLLQAPIDQLPQSYIYDRGIGNVHFKITVDSINHDFFIDDHGQKWMKVKE
jgi:hypothetical protein